MSLDSTMNLTDLTETLKSSQKTLPLTTPKPFKLTRIRARGVVVPEPLPFGTIPKARPIPKSTYTTPLEEQALARRRQLNRERAERQYVVAKTYRDARASGSRFRAVGWQSPESLVNLSFIFTVKRKLLPPHHLARLQARSSKPKQSNSRR